MENRIFSSRGLRGIQPRLCVVLLLVLLCTGAARAQEAAPPADSLQAAVEALEHALSDTPGADKDQARLRMHAMAEACTHHLLSTFVPGGVFAEAAGTLAVAEAEPTTSAVRQKGGIGKWLNGLTTLAPLAGVGLLLAGETEAASGIALGSVSLAGITGLLNASNARKEKAAAEAAAAAREEAMLQQAEARTLHTILVVDLQSAGGVSDGVRADLEGLRHLPAGTPQDGAALADRYLAVLRSVDAFYDAQLPVLRSTLAGSRESPLLTEASHQKLDEVVAGIDDSRMRWMAVRGLYARAERAALAYLTQ